MKEMIADSLIKLLGLIRFKKFVKYLDLTMEKEITRRTRQK